MQWRFFSWVPAEFVVEVGIPALPLSISFSLIGMFGNPPEKIWKFFICVNIFYFFILHICLFADICIGMQTSIQ